MTDRPKINEISLGKINSISNDKNGNIIPLPFPSKDSDSTETFDLLGVIRTITISGILTGGLVAVRTAIAALDSLVGGDQKTSHTLEVDELSAGTLNIKVASVRSNWDVSSGTSNRAEYTIQLIEGV